MHKISILALKVLRRFYGKLPVPSGLPRPECDRDPDSVSDRVYAALVADAPCMVARYGANELAVLANYLSIHARTHSVLRYIQGREAPWWWDTGALNELHGIAGFFPIEEAALTSFCELLLKDSAEVDILGAWLPYELVLEAQLEGAVRVERRRMDPFWADRPWTKALQGKRVLVIHPFAESIQQQYQRRECLFADPDFLPEFTLKTLKSVVSFCGKTEFGSWFEALEHMKAQMDAIEYDICLIGCGAYGFSLAAHAKRRGKKAVHLGGSLQLLFGIIGARWEREKPKFREDYPGLVNSFWVRPKESERPSFSADLERGCYW